MGITLAKYYNAHYNAFMLVIYKGFKDMSVKSERITILGTPDFKAFLTSEAKDEGVSVSELVRSRCQVVPPSDDEIALQELIRLAAEATKRATASLDKGVRDAETTLAELRGVS
jgi:uncharacterized protein (DUF1778 family)